MFTKRPNRPLSERKKVNTTTNISLWSHAKFSIFQLSFIVILRFHIKRFLSEQIKWSVDLYVKVCLQYMCIFSTRDKYCIMLQRIIELTWLFPKLANENKTNRICWVKCVFCLSKNLSSYFVTMIMVITTKVNLS